MNVIFKSFLFISLVISLFSCKDKVIEKPDNLVPITLTIEEINTGKYVNQTVIIEKAYFEVLPGTKFNGTSSNGAGNKTLRDCNGDALIVFTYSSDDWSYELVPTKMGPITGVVTEFNGVIQLRMRSIDDVKNMTEPKCAEIFTIATIPQILNGDFASGEIVKIEDVQFQDGTPDWGGTNKVEDCFGNILTTYVATSESYAYNPVPTGNGALIGVLDLFNSTWEIKPRFESDGAAMINTRCTSGGGGGTGSEYLYKDFQDQSITSGSWEMLNVSGSINWVTSDQGSTGNFYAKCDNGTTPANCETWLISPVVDLSTSTAPKLSFRNATFSANNVMTVLVSTNYSGNPSTATWTDITSQATLSTGSFTWTNSGSIDMSSYKLATVYVAFKYVGTSSVRQTWEVDEITIKE